MSEKEIVPGEAELDGGAVGHFDERVADDAPLLLRVDRLAQRQRLPAVHRRRRVVEGQRRLHHLPNARHITSSSLILLVEIHLPILFQ